MFIVYRKKNGVQSKSKAIDELGITIDRLVGFKCLFIKYL